MNIKAFISNTAIVGVGTITPLGELSTHTRTFSKTLQEYQLPEHETISLAVFNDVVPTQEVLEVISDTVYSMVIQSQTRSVGNYDETLLIQDISTNIGITGLTIGELVEADGQKGVEYLRFEVVRSNALNDIVELWYSDTKMRADYDIVEYTVIPPAAIPLLEQGILDLEAIVPVEAVMAITQATGEHPHTAIHRMDVVIHDMADVSNFVVLPFYIVAWGPHSNVDYLLREAVTSYILNNTSEPAAWTALIAPELWISNRFWLYPKWDEMAVTDDIDGQYTPILNISQHIGHISTISHHGLTYIAENIDVFSVSYKNLAIGSVCSTANTASNKTLRDIVPDYVADSDNMMFSAQSLQTREWSVMIHDLVTVAEGRYDLDEVGTDVIRTIEGATTYYTASTNGVTYSISKR